MTIDKLSVQNEHGKTLVRITHDNRVYLANTLAPSDARHALIEVCNGLANLHTGTVALLESMLGDRKAHPECLCPGCNAVRFLDILKNPRLH